MDGTRTRVSATALLLIATAVTGCRHAGRTDDDSSPALAAAPALLPRAGQLLITTDNGVRLRPTDDRRATVDGHLRSHWSRNGATWVLDLACPDHDPDATPCTRMPTVGVPAGTAVTVTARNAGIDATGLTGALDLTTTNGDVTVAQGGDSQATVRLTTRNGSVRATALQAAHLHARTVNGDVVLACASPPSDVTAATTNGSVRLTLPRNAPAYAVDATTDNGHPTVTLPTTTPSPDHHLTLTTVNGDISATRD
ncbi:DUF4097 family beta strand repeat-containing protein [Streptomyces sp. NPDC092296]|uniref:DUF4097 family beta strand repeat-containing protein n=1 Tax=Streptomyces sp. NPDC092296 TaxID=3366012 RepID=UPI0037F34BBE